MNQQLKTKTENLERPWALKRSWALNLWAMMPQKHTNKQVNPVQPETNQYWLFQLKMLWDGIYCIWALISFIQAPNVVNKTFTNRIKANNHAVNAGAPFNSLKLAVGLALLKLVLFDPALPLKSLAITEYNKPNEQTYLPTCQQKQIRHKLRPDNHE